MKPGLIRQVINKTKRLEEITSVEEYVDKLVHSKLSKSDKLKIGKQFVKQTGISRNEIIKIRNRNSYYKKLKNANISERMKKRNSKFSGKRKPWTNEELKLFVLITHDLTDLQLSEHFQRSIPSVNAVRRKLRIINKLNSNVNTIELLMKNESELKGMLIK